MNQAHLHVALNHFPVVGSVLATLVFLAGIYLKRSVVQKVGLWIFVFIALVTIPVFILGEGAKEIVEHLPVVEEELVEKHEYLAKISLGLLLFTGLSAATRLYMFRRGNSVSRFSWVIILFALSATGMAGFTANAGGKIRHTEFSDPVIKEDGKIEIEQDKETETGKEKGRGRKRKGRNR